MVGYCLHERATQYTMRIMVEEFPTFKNLSKFVASLDQSSAVHNSTIVPMKLLFKDEKYTDDNIQILQEYITECNLAGNPQVCSILKVIYLYTYCTVLHLRQVFVGDQATCLP